VSTPPSDLPAPSGGTTQIAGQQAAPSTTVPLGQGGPIYGQAGAGTRTNTLAIVSLVAGIGSFFAHIVPGVGGFTVAVIAIVTGYLARKQIRETGEQGMGMATAGMIIGAVHIALLVLLVIGLIFAIFVLGVVLFGVHR